MVCTSRSKGITSRTRVPEQLLSANFLSELMQEPGGMFIIGNKKSIHPDSTPKLTASSKVLTEHWSVLCFQSAFLNMDVIGTLDYLTWCSYIASVSRIRCRKAPFIWCMIETLGSQQRHNWRNRQPPTKWTFLTIEPRKAKITIQQKEQESRREDQWLCHGTHAWCGEGKSLEICKTMDCTKWLVSHVRSWTNPMMYQSSFLSCATLPPTTTWPSMD